MYNGGTETPNIGEATMTNTTKIPRIKVEFTPAQLELVISALFDLAYDANGNPAIKLRANDLRNKLVEIADQALWND